VGVFGLVGDGYTVIGNGKEVDVEESVGGDSRWMGFSGGCDIGVFSLDLYLGIWDGA
jgi:hypothetical protein